MASHQPQYTVESVAGYVAFIDKSCAGGEWLFRGQPCKEPLLPKIYRCKFWGGEPYDEGKKKIELEMFRRFKRRAVAFLDRVPSDDNDLEWLAIAQHHGLPTRLLDWSASALAALWFSVSEDQPDNRNEAKKIEKMRPCESTREQEKKTVSVVWACLPAKNDYVSAGGVTARREGDKRIKPFDMEQPETCFYPPPSIVARVTAQHSWFSVHPDREKGRERAKKKGGDAACFDPVPLEENRRYDESSDDYPEEPQDQGRLLKIEVPQDKWISLREELNRLGVNKSTIFPDLDGLCGHLQWWAQQQNRK